MQFFIYTHVVNGVLNLIQETRGKIRASEKFLEKTKIYTQLKKSVQ